jgi:hypothetical protein
MKKLRKNSKKTIIKITNAQIEAYERQYYERSNSEIAQWQQQMYSTVKYAVCESSSVGRASDFQSDGHRFESGLSL